MTASDTEQLSLLVGRKRDCLAQLRELGRRQIELIAAGDLGQLLKVLAGKQRLLAGLQTIEHELNPFRDQNPEDRSWRSPADRDACARLLTHCNSLLAEIMEQERQSERQLIEHRDEAASRLHGSQAASQARGAYAAQTHGITGQIDLSSDA